LLTNLYVYVILVLERVVGVELSPPGETGMAPPPSIAARRMESKSV